MNAGTRIADYCRHICRFASSTGVGLRMAKTPDGWSWEWQGHGDGASTAHTQPVALFHACQDLEQRLAERAMKDFTQ